MLGTTLPTPLYVIYQGRWHFSAAMVTVTFAVYAAAVIATLLLAGRSSDQAGRKPVLAVALGASALSTVVFILAPDLAALIAARIVSGLSAGLMTGTATATLTELVPASAGRRASLAATAANMGGLGLGPLVAGLFAQYAPHPTTLVFEVYLAVLAVAALLLLLVPETVRPAPAGPALRRAGHPRAGPGRVHRRRAWPPSPPSPCSGCSAPWCPASSGACCIRAATPSRAPSCSCCSRWGPSPRSLLSRFNSRRVVLAGLILFLAALALIVAALAQSAMALFLAGTVAGGVAVGAIFLGSLATANRLAPAERRGQSISAFFVACYAGLIIPVVGVGVLAGFTGTFPRRTDLLDPARGPVPVLGLPVHPGQRPGPGCPVRYQIRVRGRLGRTMRAAFPALDAQVHGEDTVLAGVLADQAALYGALAQLEALGLELLEVRRESPGGVTPPHPAANDAEAS